VPILKNASFDNKTLIQRLPFYYGWVNVLIAGIAMTATLPGRTHGIGLIEKPLCDELHIPESVFDAMNFWAVILGASFSWLAGLLLDKFGSRLTLTAIALALGSSVLFMSRVESSLALRACLTLVRGFGQGALTVASMALVGKWFTCRLGPAMGVFLVVVGFGFAAVTLGLGEAVIRFGWRVAWAGVGWALLAGLAALCCLFVRNTPEACGLAMDEETPEKSPEESGPTGATLGIALRTPAFWVVTIGISLYGLIWSAITLHNQRILEEHGFGERQFYIAMAVLAFSGMISNLLGGWLTALPSMGKLLAIGMLLLAIALVAFPAVTSFTGLMAYALALGSAGGIISVAYFALYPYAFGRRHLGHIQGAAQILSIFASAIGPILLTASKDWTGSYHLMFLSTAPIVALLGVAAWIVPLPHSTSISKA